MTGSRLALVIILAIGFTSPAFGQGGLFNRKQKLDAPRVRQLTEIVRLDPSEKKRQAAVEELAGADPRVQLDVIPVIGTALQKDPSAAVRVTAAELIGRFNIVFPMAGLALESAMETDPSPAVREAARQALWEYHLIGYRSAKGADGIAGQTREPPLAKPARPPVPVTAEPPVVPAAAAAAPQVDPLPPVTLLPGPRVTPVGILPRPLALLSAFPPHPNLTVEPPVAAPPSSSVPPPSPSVTAIEPPIRGRWPEPSTAGKPPPIARFLPPIVPHPGPIPGVTPLPEPTAEPPIARRQ